MINQGVWRTQYKLKCNHFYAFPPSICANVNFSQFLLSYLFLDGHFHLNPFRVWLRPQKASINETDL